MTFDEAYSEMVEGNALRRAGWNAKGLWVEMQFPDKHSKMTQPYLYMNILNGASNHFGDDENPVLDRVPWVPSQTDMFVDDWEVVDIKADG